MTIYLLISNGVVSYKIKSDTDITQQFDPSLTWVTTTDDNIIVGWIYNGSIFSAPPQDYTDMWLKIQVERDRRKFNGVLVQGNWFHTDDSSRIQQIGLVMMGANMPAGIMWKTKTNTFVPMTPSLAGAIFQSVATQDVTIFSVAETHRQNLFSSKYPLLYDFSAGWPATFTG